VHEVGGGKIFENPSSCTKSVKGRSLRILLRARTRSRWREDLWIFENPSPCTKEASARWREDLWIFENPSPCTKEASACCFSILLHRPGARARSVTRTCLRGIWSRDVGWLRRALRSFVWNRIFASPDQCCCYGLLYVAVAFFCEASSTART